MHPAKTLESETDSVASDFKNYAYSVSHDLSKPVRAMVEFSKLLKAEYPDALNTEATEYLSLIIENGARLQQMMDGLLDYSRLNTMAKPFTKVDCNRLLEDCKIILEDKIKQTRTVIETATLPPVKADVDQLVQLLLVILDNAIKFHKPGVVPHIKISAVQQKDKVRFSITDNGIGVAPEFRDQIFQIFRRLHLENEYTGVGIGLTLAKKIVQRHGGEISCESSPSDQGLTVSFTLPSGENP